MLVRPFLVEDTETVVALWRECGLTRPWNDPYRDIERKLLVQPELFLVAVPEHPTAAGEADVPETAESPSILATAMAGYDGHRGWIYYFAVAPALQRTGVGRILLGEVENRLEALGCPKVQLQVRPDNAGAVEFYRSAEFEPFDAHNLGRRLIPDD